MEKVGHKERNFDIDLQIGESGENKLYDLLAGSKLEVKHDLMAYSTGNIAIEYESRGKLSGLSTTQATYWAFVLAEIETIVVIETNRLKELTKKHWNKRIVGGDTNSSKMVLIPLTELFKK